MVDPEKYEKDDEDVTNGGQVNPAVENAVSTSSVVVEKEAPGPN